LLCPLKGDEKIIVLNQIKPIISVIIPVHNGETYLAEAIKSVTSQQQPLELIIIDDGSTDRSREIAKSFTPHVIVQNQQGTAVALNHGILKSTGSYLAFIDADDLWVPEKIKSQKKFLDENQSVEFVLGMVEQFLSPDFISGDGKIQIPDKPQTGYLSGAMLAQRSVFNKLGLFEPNLKAGFFIDWIVRAQNKNIKFHILNQVVLRRRIHTNNMMHSSSNFSDSYLKMVMLHLQRKRLVT